MHDTVGHRFEDVLRDMVASLIDVREELARVRAEVAEVREESRRFHRNPLASFRRESEFGIKSVASIDDSLTRNSPANNTSELDDDDQSFVKVDKSDSDDSNNVINSSSPFAHRSVEKGESEPFSELKMCEEKECLRARQPTQTVGNEGGSDSSCSARVLQRTSIYQTPVGGDRCQADLTQEKHLSMVPFCFVAVAIVCLMAALAARWIPPARLPGAERKFDDGHHHKQHRGHGERPIDMESARNRHRHRDNSAGSVSISPAKRIVFAGNQPESTRLNVVNRNLHRYVAWWISAAVNETTENGDEEDIKRYDYWRMLNLGVEGGGSGSKPDPQCQCGVLAPRDRLMLEIVKRGFPIKLSGTLHDTLRIEWMELDALYDDAERRFDETTVRRVGCATWIQRLRRDQRRAAGNEHRKTVTAHTNTVELIYKL